MIMNRFGTLLFLVFCLSGCFLNGKIPFFETSAVRTAEQVALYQKYQNLGARYEKSQEWSKALLMWQVAASVPHNGREPEDKIDELQNRIKRESNRHYTCGMEALKNGSLQAARKEFLLALAVDPQHGKALVQLKALRRDGDFTVYSAAAGDTPARVAQKVYRDPGKAFIVEYFNDSGKDGSLHAGEPLRLPLMEGETKTAVVNENKKVKAKAKPKNSVSPPVVDKTGAEEHYRKGVAFYLNEQFTEALAEWKETIRLYPDHPNAHRDMQRVHNLLKKG